MELIVKHIKSRFIKPESVRDLEINSIRDVLDLPVNTMKGLPAVAAAGLKKLFGVDTIRDLSKLDPANPFDQFIPEDVVDPREFANLRIEWKKRAAEELGEDFDLKRYVMVAQMVGRAWQKRKVYKAKKETKVIVLGLNNAGKTAILSALGGKFGISDLKKLKPTKRIERRKIVTKDLIIHIWDFGGQADYRKAYLKEPEKMFVGSSLIIYVIDMQDPEHYNESFEYFSQILEELNFLGEAPYALVFLHKSDPDVVEDPDFQLNLEYCKGRVVDIMREANLDYDVYVTSIYNFFSTEPKFARFIKDALTDQVSLVDPTRAKLEGMGDLLDSTMNLVVQLADSVNGQFVGIHARLDGIERRLAAIERGATLQARTTQEGAAAPRLGTPPGLKPPPSHEPREVKARGTQLRSTILSELKSLFQKRRELD
ncbi:MAG: ADP-ribosylation factor-like protein [Promethearchaeota archaeon]